MGQVLHGRLAGQAALTWVTGAVAFLGSIATAFTGHLVQSNFDSQWISTQAKDGLNSVGVGAWFNVLNYGQMLFHVVLFPLVLGLLVLGLLVLGLLVVWHVLLVRRRGVVPPFASREQTEPEPQAEPEPAAAESSTVEVAS